MILLELLVVFMEECARGVDGVDLCAVLGDFY